MYDKKNARIVYMGTPEISAIVLEGLIEEGYNLVGLVCNPDKPVGRKGTLTPCPTKVLALAHGIPVFQPAKIRLDHDFLKGLEPDVIVTMAYGQIVPQEVLDCPKKGCVNLHGSLLPKYRGAAPIQRAVYNGEKETGITIMDMNERLDEGDILSQNSIPISSDDTSDSLFTKLISVGTSLLERTIDKIMETDNNIPAVKQDPKLATYASKLTKQEALINFNAPAEEIERHIRAFISWPVGYITVNDKNIKIWGAELVHENSSKEPGTIIKIDKSGICVATAEKVIKLTALQLPGKKNMPVSSIINGHTDLFKVGQIL